MKRIFFALLALCLTSSVFAQSATFGGVLTGSQEDPPNNSLGFGNVTVTLDDAHTSVNVVFNYSSLTGSLTGAHIHRRAPEARSGGIRVGFPLDQISNGQANFTLPIDKADGDALFTTPNLFYVNLHTAQFPQGEIRADLNQTTGGAITLAATLRGNEETPPNNSTAVGTFFATIDEANNLIYELNVTGLQNVTAAHIHPGALGVMGSPLIGLDTPATGRSSGSVSIASLTPAQLADLRGTPQNFYVNVHTQAFPGGEVRGQLVPANEYDVAISGRVANASGQLFVTDARIFNPSFTSRAAALIEYLPSSPGGNTSATASITFDLPPRGTGVLDDIGGMGFLNANGTTGALRISSTMPLAVTSRIFNDQRAGGQGTFGQFVPALARSSALRRGVLPNLSFNTEMPARGFRTNVGIFNPNTAPVVIRMTLWNTDGTEFESIVVTRPGLSQEQRPIGDYFPTARAGFDNLTVSFDASAPIFMYGSVVDNISSDQVFVIAQPDAGVATAP
jgi:hypothetical protein